MGNNNKVFFNGLNELRALAALAVLIHHVELYKRRLGFDSFYDFGGYFRMFINQLGKNGVFLFFVLSGFLITYLLLEEKFKKGEIAIGKFYIRRVLRIWPLYFIILIFSFFIIPYLYSCFSEFFSGQTFYNERIENLIYGKNLLLYVVFLSNIALICYGPVAGSAQSWSVSVEEQFYLFWPWVIKLFSKHLLVVFITIIVGANLLSHFFSESFIYSVVKLSHIDYMAMGATIAYFYRNFKSKMVFLFKNKLFILLVLVSVVIHLFYNVSIFSKSLTFALLIVSVIETNFKVKTLNYIGKLSYGVYMYHPFVMYLSFAILDQLVITSIPIYNLVLYILMISLTFLLSYLSYNYIELYFLKGKVKVSPVLSGNN